MMEQRLILAEMVLSELVLYGKIIWNFIIVMRQLKNGKDQVE
jgi:hypothetical protein